MAVSGRQGMVSLRALVLIAGVGAIAALAVGPVRSWAMGLLSANAARGAEFERRVQAKRLAGAEPYLAEAGIEVEGVGSVAGESAAPGAASAETERGFLAQLARWWRRVRGVPEPVQAEPASRPSLPDLPDSLGLRPGERMVLPDGRVVEYDSTTFRVERRP